MELGHVRHLGNMEAEGRQEYLTWRDKNMWAIKEADLYNKMINSDEYSRLKKDFEQEQKKFNSKFLIGKNIKIFILLLGLVWKIVKAELNQQNSDSGNVNESEKRRIQFVISGGDSAKPFELLEEAFNQMTLFI